MKHSWQEKLDERGLQFVEACAKLRRLMPPATLDVRAWHAWMKQQKEVLSAYADDLEPKRTVKLDPRFVRLYHRAIPDTGLNERELRFLFEKHGLPVSLADEMELAERFALTLEADRNLRIEVYVTIARAMILLRRLFSDALKKQFGSQQPSVVMTWLGVVGLRLISGLGSITKLTWRRFSLGWPESRTRAIASALGVSMLLCRRHPRRPSPPPPTALACAS